MDLYVQNVGKRLRRDRPRGSRGGGRFSMVMVEMLGNESYDAAFGVIRGLVGQVD